DEARGAEDRQQEREADLLAEELAEEPAVDRQQLVELRVAQGQVDLDHPDDEGREREHQQPYEPAPDQHEAQRLARDRPEARLAQRPPRFVTAVALVVDRHQSWTSWPSARRNTSSSVSAPGRRCRTCTPHSWATLKTVSGPSPSGISR